MDKSNKFNSKL